MSWLMCVEDWVRGRGRWRGEGCPQAAGLCLAPEFTDVGAGEVDSGASQGLLKWVLLPIWFLSLKGCDGCLEAGQVNSQNAVPAIDFFSKWSQ